MSYDILEYIQGKVPTGGMIRCPFHDDQNASAHCIPGSGKFYCFVCNIAGDQVEIAKRVWFPDEPWLEGLKLARIVLKAEKYPTIKFKKPEVLTPIEIEEHTEVITKWCRICCKALQENTELLDTLRDERSINNPIKFGMGVASLKAFYELNKDMANSLPYWESKRIDLLTTTGIIKSPDILKNESLSSLYRLNDRIIIPEIRNKKAIYYQARAQEKDHMFRYLNPKIPHPLYGLESLRNPSPFIWLVEGVFDMIPLQEIGQAVVSCNGLHIHDYKIDEIKRYLNDRIIVILFDNDKVKANGQRPGYDQAKKNLIKFTELGINAKMLFPPEQYKDLGEWITDTSAQHVVNTIQWLI